MKKHHLIRGLSILAIALAFSACKKDNSSRSASGTEVKFAVSADNAASSLTASVNTGGLTTNAGGGTSVNWTSAIANIAYFKLEAKRRNTEIEIKTRSLLNVNLLAVTPAGISAAIDTGTYREIEIKVVLAKSSSGAIPLTLKGMLTTAGGAAVPIEFDFNDDAEIKAEAENVTIDGSTDIATTIKLHLNRLAQGISPAELDAATRTGGVIIISNNVNVSIYNKIKNNFSSSGEGEGFEHRRKDDRGKDN